LPKIRCAILCIQGKDDEYGTTAQVQAIRAVVPGTGIVVLAACKHSPHRDQADTTLERVAEFVAEVESRLPSGFAVKRKTVDSSAPLAMTKVEGLSSAES
jgi:predicted alpha/beta-hydrolase family hydrolase